MTSRMKEPLIFCILAALIAALFIPSIAYAGGWAVITLDRLPDRLTAGESFPLGMMVRQHGRTPWEVDSLQINARRADSAKTLTFTAVPDGQPGHYQVELLFPEPGRWEWEIASGLYPEGQPMPALEVVGDTQLAAPPVTPMLASIPDTQTGYFAVGVMTILIFAAGLYVIARMHERRLRVLAGAALIVLSGGLAFAVYTSADAAARKAQSVPVSAARAESGQALFLAKGCVVCHANNRAITLSEQYGVSAGPDLTGYQNDPAFLRQFLADPTAIKATSEMPDLGLTPDEIDALVRFINSQEGR